MCWVCSSFVIANHTLLVHMPVFLVGRFQKLELRNQSIKTFKNSDWLCHLKSVSWIPTVSNTESERCWWKHSYCYGYIVCICVCLCVWCLCRPELMLGFFLNCSSPHFIVARSLTEPETQGLAVLDRQLGLLLLLNHQYLYYMVPCLLCENLHSKHFINWTASLLLIYLLKFTQWSIANCVSLLLKFAFCKLTHLSTFL